jgi:hypothetical protein
MTRRRSLVGLLLCLVALTAVGAECNEEDLGELVEGEAFELGDLRYNILFTRFLNVEDVEDRDYLTGQPPAPAGKDHLAVFLLLENEGSDPVTIPESSDFKLTDTTGATYAPIESDSLFALQFGATIEPGDEVPAGDSVAASGPVEGAMVLFLVDQAVTENRPLDLDISSDDGEAKIELDI